MVIRCCFWFTAHEAAGLPGERMKHIMCYMSTFPVCGNLPRWDSSKHGSLIGCPNPSCKVQFHGPTKPLNPPSRTCLWLGNTREERWQRRTGPGAVARSPRCGLGDGGSKWTKEAKTLLSQAKESDPQSQVCGRENKSCKAPRPSPKRNLLSPASSP